jgi:hypothetical protein
MANEHISIEKFWDAVIKRDYDTVRKAIAAGFDVNAPIPGKVPPITFAQPAEDMVMLKMLWAAGTHPATPWLQMVFDDFASGGDGSKFRTKKVKPVGRMVLHRFNGDEEFAIERALIRRVGSHLEIKAVTNGTVIKSLPDTKGLPASPRARISIAAPIVKNWVNLKLSLPDGDTEESNATFYYVEHESLTANEITFLERKKNQYLLKWTAQTPDVNYYDGSKPDTLVEIEGWFTLEA